ncbi:hypothetical protein TI39_contig687g00005 [Zymoseptoria brevis]|uniref:Uncharacterized protein n=1 Tax=Zymoseptoria brevis TaxID=1047168 RepID=A0A0F4GG52_9PEZI|nr:hypothetical protein TI39_contig687g00005 [Zymoseptoria brevis]
MTLPEYALDYQSCSLTELRKFYIQRHDLASVSGISVLTWLQGNLTDALVEALENLDLDSSFPFLDLSPELRLMVYPYLLCHHHSQIFCNGHRSLASEAFPEILRASKLCYKEARDILYAQSSLPLCLLDYNMDTAAALHVGGDIDYYDDAGKDLPFDGLSSQLAPFANLQYVNVLIENFSHRRSLAISDGLSYLLTGVLSTFSAGNSLMVLKIKYGCECFKEMEEVEYAFDGEDGIATPEDVQDFEKGLRSSLALNKLPATTGLELVDFRKATWNALRGLRQDLTYLRSFG